MQGSAAIADDWNMAQREDILRGARAGSGILAALLVCYAGYRMVHEDAAGIEESKPKSAVAPRPGPSKSQASIPGGRGAVPPPPPRSAATARRNAARANTKPNPKQDAGIAPSLAGEKETAATGFISEPAAAVEEEQNRTSVKMDASTEPSPVSDEPSAPAQARRKGWLKAVGRFLHIGGRKDQIEH